MLKSLEEVFKANLLRLRGSRTQADIAELAGIPLRSYQNVEANGAIPQGPNRKAIAQALGVPETHLFVDLAEFSAGAASVTPSEALAVLEKAINSWESPSTVDPRIARLLAAIDSNPAILEKIETLIDALSPADKKEPAGRRAR